MQQAVKEGLERVERAIEKAKSKQPRFSSKGPDPDVFFGSTLRWVTSAQDSEPPYEPDNRKRDLWLSKFWRREPHLAGVLSSVNAIDANRGWHLTGGRNQVQRFTEVLREAEDGAGWRAYISLQSTAYYTADIGALTETGRDGEGGPLRELYHLDPTKCRLTGDRKGPLLYNSSKEPWAADDYFRLVSMRNILEEYHGLGWCAESRVLDLSKIMLAVYSHELEMLGARAPKGLLLLQNISQEQWQEAMKARDAALDSEMRKYYNAVAVLAQQGVDSIDAKLVALSQLPEGFNLEVFTNLLMYAYALCFGYDPIEFWPVLAGQLGRGRETDIQHRKGTGKGGLNFMLAFQEQLQRELPSTLQFEFEQRDQEGVLLDAEVTQAWANVAATLYTGGSSMAPGPAGSKGGDGEPAESEVLPAANTIKNTGSILTHDQVMSLLAMKGVIPASWTNMDEDVTSTDAKDAQERYKKDQLMENEIVRRAIYQFPNEPIVRYSWPTGRTEVLFRVGSEALQRTRYTLVKPFALIPDFVGEDEVEAISELKIEEKPIPQKRVESGFNMYRGDTPPLSINVKDRKGKEIDVSAATEVTYFITDKEGKTRLIKELGRGIAVDRSVITVEFEPLDTLYLLGIYSHSVKVMDDIGRTFTVFQGDMAVLEEFVDA